MAEFSIEQTFDQAVQHHRAGQLSQAGELYRHILQVQPNHSGALHLLGVVSHQEGRNGIAADLIRRAIVLCPNWAQAWANLGEILRLGGQLDESIVASRKAIALEPKQAESHFNLGIALWEKRQLDEAIKSYRQAIALRPDYPEALSNLGNALMAGGQLKQAIAAQKQAITLRPEFPEGLINLGNALQADGQINEAIAMFRRAIALNPRIGPAHDYLGTALRAGGQLDAGIACFRRAIELKPDFAAAHFHLGDALREKGQLDAAIEAFRQAISRSPHFSQAFNDLGRCLRDAGRIDQAIDAYQQAIALNPEFPNAHKNLGLAMLQTGNFAQGWQEYEWRWKCQGLLPQRTLAEPPWDGRSFKGATLLLHAEQGLGDTIQFVRYLPMVAARGGKIILGCPPELHKLLKPFAGEHRLMDFIPNCEFDFHCPLLSLPRIFQTELETIPRQTPYLHADSSLVGKWKDRLTSGSGSFKVGLAWAGSGTHTNDRNRSMALRAFAPLARLPGISFYSLQKGAPAEQLKDAPDGLNLIDMTADLTDFCDTAALVANLDLIISVDTAVAHLAGAMGKPTWVLLAFVADWRWMMDRDDSPWYPTMRLLRQRSAGDWTSVIAAVFRALNELTARSPTQTAL